MRESFDFFFFLKLCNIVFQQPGWFIDTPAFFLKTLHHFFVYVTFSNFTVYFLRNLLLISPIR